MRSKPTVLRADRRGWLSPAPRGPATSGNGGFPDLVYGTLAAYLAEVWGSGEVLIEIEEAEGHTVIATVRTPVGTLTVLAELELVGRVLWVRGAHIQGLSPGALGRAGLNAVARKFLEEADADALVVDRLDRGAVKARTIGARPRRFPRPFRFPR